MRRFLVSLEIVGPRVRPVAIVALVPYVGMLADEVPLDGPERFERLVASLAPPARLLSTKPCRVCEHNICVSVTGKYHKNEINVFQVHLREDIGIHRQLGMFVHLRAVPTETEHFIT